MIDFLSSFWFALTDTAKEKFEQICRALGLGDKLNAFYEWLKKDEQNRQIVKAGVMLFLAVLILSVYACSQMPNVR